MAPPPDLSRVASRAAGAARDRFGVRRAAIFWREADAEGLTCIASAGEGGAAGWVRQTLATGVGMAGRAVREGRPVWTPDLLADPRVPIAPWLRDRMVQEGLRAVTAVPVRIEGATHGALGFLDGPGRTFAGEDPGRTRPTPVGVR